ncbi:hypothetical protein [Murinocardiopsis flavida]|nr:hypothetical protein [Murinocardiopsis flavida]
MDTHPLNRQAALRSASVVGVRRGTSGILLMRGRLGSPPRSC